MSGLEGKPFAIPKKLVWQAWKRVKANGGAAGADGVSVAMSEAGLADSLLQDLEPDVVGHVLSAPGAGRGDTESLGRHENAGRADGTRKLPGRAGIVRFRNRSLRSRIRSTRCPGSGCGCCLSGGWPEGWR